MERINDVDRYSIGLSHKKQDLRQKLLWPSEAGRGVRQNKTTVGMNKNLKSHDAHV